MTVQGTIRKLRVGERDKVRNHLLRLEGPDRQLRFGGHVNSARIAAYCAELDFSRALVLGYLVEGEVRAIGELKRLAGRWPRTAEIAISVERRFQGCGVGSKLLRGLIVAARNRLFQRLYMVCLIDNSRMTRLARRFDGRLKVDRGEVEARIEPPWPTWWTVLEESLDEAGALVGETIAERAGRRPGAGSRRARRPGRAWRAAGARRRPGGACAGGSTAV
ncbi:MAG TPA: GNAT family N-acetyltransferase [Geminicoccaceae bacterium]|nr:GNAT family N-acetyltransferase [Geminicoccaceae bacterium]